MFTLQMSSYNACVSCVQSLLTRRQLQSLSIDDLNGARIDSVNNPREVTGLHLCTKSVHKHALALPVDKTSVILALFSPGWPKNVAVNNGCAVPVQNIHFICGSTSKRYTIQVCVSFVCSSTLVPLLRTPHKYILS